MGNDASKRKGGAAKAAPQGSPSPSSGGDVRFAPKRTTRQYGVPSAPITAMAFHSTGLLAVGTSTGVVKFWAQSSGIEAEFEAPAGRARSSVAGLEFCGPGKLACVLSNSAVTVYDLETLTAVGAPA